jgi:hypothetical protein
MLLTSLKTTIVYYFKLNVTKVRINIDITKIIIVYFNDIFNYRLIKR